MVTISKELLDAIIKHAQDSYPFEGCGILTGKGEEIIEVNFVQNKNADRKNDRYEIDPRDFLKIDRSASEKGYDIIGFYHSHPDHPALPSNFDVEHAWQGYIYIIISVANGKKNDVRAWKLSPENREIKEVQLNIKK
jgi:proteasome lid subunit RPN8/RPN11